jgi:uncharacterized Zn finger protein
MADKSENYLDDLYCEECEEETEHYVYIDGHERDSSKNYKKCLECGTVTHGI